jgi:hypothetical protein
MCFLLIAVVILTLRYINKTLGNSTLSQIYDDTIERSFDVCRFHLWGKLNFEIIPFGSDMQIVTPAHIGNTVRFFRGGLRVSAK